MGMIEHSARRERRIGTFQQAMLYAALGGGMVAIGAIPDFSKIIKYYANAKKGGRKRSHWKHIQGGRSYIDDRPPLDGAGHLEMDFIVSKLSPWVLLVIVDRYAKRTWVKKLPNRKRGTIRAALSGMLKGVVGVIGGRNPRRHRGKHEPNRRGVTIRAALTETLKGGVVRSITTNNDIDHTCWRELEVNLHTRIYFTHPYHSWEKGLVENTNRWIRCFVPKRRDIESVTQEELHEIHAFLNDRPRECIGFRSPREYYENLTASVLLEG